ncbi:FkbM family methyltransferase [Alteromonas pelagimontana]|uniref:FkbM family methyltransferase n=1 Tax=Alteromonas pelagimontana TaxID=1858656 RepID=A0A6M4MIB8_9ALTE|nr:FkbM family methyltransferase [Alteromonas pelagimontana]QJR81846.1 FkbM family methyltransferase [Alteromonas pelagimontana]
MKNITIPDNHEHSIDLILSNLANFFADDRKSNKLRTVLHIGAHKGEEVPYYLKFGFTKIYLVEAIPELVNHLEEKYYASDSVAVFHRAISNCNGTTEFSIHKTKKGSVESSSLLPLKALGEIVPVFDSRRKIEVPVSTIDYFVASLGIDEVNLLCLDIQGAELMALQGAEGTLRNLDCLICEVNLLENYEGGAQEKDIEDWLFKRGFVKIFTIYHELYKGDHTFPAWGEGLWINSIKYPSMNLGGEN